MTLAGKLPTIQDVARRAQVSTATVSRALSSPDLVSASTRERVSEAVIATGYAINQAARSLRSRAAHTVVFAFPNIGNAYYSAVLDGVVAETSARGYGALVANRLGENPTEWLKDYFLSNRADGMVLFDGSLDVTQFYDRKTQRRFPLVVACDELPDPRLNAVMIDNRSSGAMAVRHLLDLGHRRIGHVLVASKTPGLQSDRYLGYLDALREAGISVRSEWVFAGDFTIDTGVRAGEAFLALKDRPTAMFVANDEMAMGFLHALRGAGVRVPQDVSVIGFDDSPSARCMAPTLTTIRQPRFDIGQKSARLLVDLLEGDSWPESPVQIVLDCELIVRESTAPPSPALQRS